MNRSEKNRSKKRSAKYASRKQEAARVEEMRKREQKNRQLRDAYIATVGLSAITFFFLYLLFATSWPLYKAYFVIPTQSWRETNGTMRRIRMGYSSGRQGGWWVNGTYNYQVGNQQFAGNRLRFMSEESVHSLYERLEPGTSVKVFYEKEDPQFSTLYLPREKDKNDVAFHIVQGSCMALLLTVVTALFIRLNIKLRRELYPQNQRQLSHVFESG